jgi:outer membrane protein
MTLGSLLLAGTAMAASPTPSSPASTQFDLRGSVNPAPAPPPAAKGTPAAASPATGASRGTPASAQPSGNGGPPETLADALVSAYSTNSALNAERGRARAIDESVPQALSALRPTVTAGATASGTVTESGSTTSRNGVVTVNQTLFNGFRNINGVRGAETAVLSERETLINIEQTTLLNAATAFMNLVQAQATLNLRANNVRFLQEEVAAAQERLYAGTGTQTDVASASASLAAGETLYYQAQAVLNTTIATYQQVIGHRPMVLGAAQSVDNLLPPNLDAALTIGLSLHPAIKIAEYNVDAADLIVKTGEGALLPTATLAGAVTEQAGPSTHNVPTESGTVVAGISIPIYTGGAGSARVRAAKEILDQQRILLDAAKDSVKQSVTASWGALDAARSSVQAAAAAVTASQLALNGFQAELMVGQATTLDVLNAQEQLLTAQVAQVTAQHDRVVGSYALLAATGLLTAEYIGLDVAPYDPAQHYQAVRNKLGGTTTPDGR